MIVIPPEKTTASNRKLRTLLVAIRGETLIPRPDFQRRLVWTNKDKKEFIRTALEGFPFPEIYIAAGSVNPETGEGTEMLVDGQQRISTLYQYFTGSKDLKLGKDVPPYAQLDREKQLRFLEYDVVVRDLGQMSIDNIKEIFKRINSTKYSLNAMEIHNARFDGEFKKFAEKVSEDPFFDKGIFSANDIRRMDDLRFTLSVIITIMSTYFNRDDEFENYLYTYNDEFDLHDRMESEIDQTLRFVEACHFASQSRVWKKSDLLTLLVEVHRAIIKKELKIDPDVLGHSLHDFYNAVDNRGDIHNPKYLPKDLEDYGKAASQATNDRGSRLKRGQIIEKIIEEAVTKKLQE